MAKSRRRVKSSGKGGTGHAGRAWAEKGIRHGHAGGTDKKVARSCWGTRDGHVNSLEAFLGCR